MAVRKGYVDVKDGQLHYREAGPESGVPIVFLHQTASSGAMWEQVISRLEKDYKIYALDTPGFGGSYDIDELPAISYYTDVFMEALDNLGVGEFHLVGHHTGACMAVEMGAGWPDRVKTLSLFGPVQLTQAERDEFSKHFSGPFTPKSDGSHLMQNWKYLDELGVAGRVVLHHREVTDMLRAWKGRALTYDAVWKQDFPAFFRKCTCPCLIMAARDDVLYAYLPRAKEAHPDAEMVELKGANFEPDLDPDGSATAIRNFLKKNGF
jgi:pimeloyl-ACP methyl ester carboxylesterase